MIDIYKQNISKLQLQHLIKNLTVHLSVYNNPTQKKTVIFFTNKDFSISVPRFYAFTHLKIKKLNESLLQHTMNQSLYFHGQLFNTAKRPQTEAFQTLTQHLKTHHGGIVVMAPGSGKTNLMIAVALHFKLKVMVLVHTTLLLGQWKKRIEDFVKSHSQQPVKVGVIHQNVCVTEECDFVIAMIQSLNARNYPQTHLQCGIVVVDEVHHIAAETFSKVLSKVQYYYSIGLTATPKRSDHLEHIMEYLIGPICFKMKIPKNKSVQVNMITYNLGQQIEIKYKNGTKGLSSMITNLTKDTFRNKLLLDVINLVQIKFPDRKGLLLSARVDHLKQIYRSLDPSLCAIITGNINTELSKAEQRKAKKEQSELKFTKFLTLSTFSMFAEAVDFDGDFIILATPKLNVEQSTGRILRGRDLKYSPVIFDIVDPFSSFNFWRYRRLNFYKERGYEIVYLKDSQIYKESTRTNQLQISTLPNPKRRRGRET
jgi:superfamily II DNA or RNA helicase